MRYWIYWNDLIQGPFELDELISLRAFDEHLMVCMEDRQDWVPAGRVADLAPAIEELRARWSPPLASPPPPPRRPASHEPLQGDFFGESPQQPRLLETDEGPKGPYAYWPVGGERENALPDYGAVVTMPIHFARIENTAPAPSIEKILTQVIRESPVQEFVPSPEETVAESKPPFVMEVLPEEAIQASPLPSLEMPTSTGATGNKLALVPWLLGISLVLALSITGLRWALERYNTRSAIAEANRLESVPRVAAPAENPLSQAVGVPPFPPQGVIQAIATPPGPAVKQEALVRPAEPKPLRRKEAIRVVRRKAVGSARNTISDKAVALLRQWSKKALGGKAAWSAEPIDDHRYQVSLHFFKTLAGGERVEGPSYEFEADLENRHVAAHNAETEAKFFRTPTKKKNTVNPASTKKPAAATPVPVSKGTPEVVKSNTGTEPDLLEASAESVAPEYANAGRGPEAATSALPGIKTSGVGTPSAPAKKDRWANRQNDAINLVMSKNIPRSKITIGNQARTSLQQMHEKELLHAAETGERLYLPDKISWSALRETGARYRVYLNFLSMQANGERVQTRGYQFMADLDRRGVTTDDAAAEQEFLTPPGTPLFKHNPMVDEIDALLGGVDAYNKQKMRSIIIKDHRKNRSEQKSIAEALSSAKNRLNRGMGYFRRTYPETILNNIAKAYDFTELLK